METTIFGEHVLIVWILISKSRASSPTNTSTISARQTWPQPSWCYRVSSGIKQLKFVCVVDRFLWCFVSDIKFQFETKSHKVHVQTLEILLESACAVYLGEIVPSCIFMPSFYWELLWGSSPKRTWNTPRSAAISDNSAGSACQNGTKQGRRFTHFYQIFGRPLGRFPAGIL